MLSGTQRWFARILHVKINFPYMRHEFIETQLLFALNLNSFHVLCFEWDAASGNTCEQFSSTSSHWWDRLKKDFYEYLMQHEQKIHFWCSNIYHFIVHSSSRNLWSSTRTDDRCCWSLQAVWNSILVSYQIMLKRNLQLQANFSERTNTELTFLENFVPIEIQYFIRNADGR